jgi:hypothetical protein
MTDLLFTVNGPTAGAILVEWNVHESTQGSGLLPSSLYPKQDVANSISCDVGLPFSSWRCCWFKSTVSIFQNLQPEFVIAESLKSSDYFESSQFSINPEAECTDRADFRLFF